MSDTNENINATTENTTQTEYVEREFASPLKRLIAVIIDYLVFIIPTFVLLVSNNLLFTLNEENLITLVSQPLSSYIIAYLLILIIQALLIMYRSQTIGKFCMNIVILDYETDKRCGFFRIVFKRLLLINAIGGLLTKVPVVGVYLSLVFFIYDAVCIFKHDRLCFHDLVAQTFVANAVKEDFDSE